jgi:hypothetical protein
VTYNDRYDPELHGETAPQVQRMLALMLVLCVVLSPIAIWLLFI